MVQSAFHLVPIDIEHLKTIIILTSYFIFRIKQAYIYNSYIKQHGNLRSLIDQVCRTLFKTYNS